MPKKLPLTEKSKANLAKNLHETRMKVFSLHQHLNKFFSLQQYHVRRVELIHDLMKELEASLREKHGIPKPKAQQGK